MIRRLLRRLFRRRRPILDAVPRRLTPSTLGSLTPQQRLSYLASWHAMTPRKDGLQ